MRNFHVDLGNGMTLLEFTGGLVGVIDTSDKSAVGEYLWRANRDRNTFYARSSVRTHPGQVTVRMHAVLVNPPPGMVVDHINGDGLDNRRSSLRIVTHRENGQNMHCSKSSRFSGVSWNKRSKNWQATILISSKKFSLGLFDDEKTAAAVYRSRCASLQDSARDDNEEPNV